MSCHHVHVHTYTLCLCECIYNESLQVKLLLEWEQTYINYRSLDLPSTINPNHPRGQHGGGQFWWWFVDTVFTLKDDLYDISTIKTLLYPEEVGPEYIGMYHCINPHERHQNEWISLIRVSHVLS